MNTIIKQLPFDHVVLLTMHGYEWPLWHSCSDIVRRLRQLGFECSRRQVAVVLSTLKGRQLIRNDSSHHSHWTLTSMAVENFLPNVTSILSDEELEVFGK